MSAAPPLRVLIVDDEAPARNRLRDLLADCAQAGCRWRSPARPTTAGAALDLLPACRADVVLLDIRMPEMDGIEVAQHLQKLDAAAGRDFHHRLRCLCHKAFEVHAVDYLLKPIRAGAAAGGAVAGALGKRCPGVACCASCSPPRARSICRVNERGSIHLMPLADVLFLKAELKYVTVRTAKREYLIEESLTALEQELLEPLRARAPQLPGGARCDPRLRACRRRRRRGAMGGSARRVR